MASNPSSTPSEARSLNLKILAQLAGADTTMQFSAIPSTTTIAELKGLIRDNAPMRPAVDRQRLIYKGHALVRDSDTLATVLGSNAVTAGDTINLHLVVRDNGALSNPHAPRPTSTSQAGADSTTRNSIPLPAGLPAPRPPPQTYPVHGMSPFHGQPMHTTLPGHPPFQQNHVRQPGMDNVGVVQQSPFPATPHLGQSQLSAHPHRAHFMGPQGFPMAPTDIQAMVMNQRARLAALQHQHQNNQHELAALNARMPSLSQGDAARATVSMPTSLRSPELTSDLHQASGNQAQPASGPPQGIPNPNSTSSDSASREAPDPSSERPFAQNPEEHAQPQQQHSHGITHQQWTVTFNAQMPPPAHAGSPLTIPDGTSANALPGVAQSHNGHLHHGHLHNGNFRLPSPPNNMIGQTQLPHLPPQQQLVPPSWPGSPVINGGFYGPSHARITMTRHQNQLEALSWSLNAVVDQRPRTEQQRWVAGEQARAQLEGIVHARNTGQEAINNAIAPSSQVAEPATANDVQALQSLNQSFQQTYNSMRQRLREFERSHTAPSENLSTQTQTPGMVNRDEARQEGDNRREQSANGSSGPAQDGSESVTAYLLASQNGPHAVVYSSQGLFASARQDVGEEIRMQNGRASSAATQVPSMHLNNRPTGQYPLPQELPNLPQTLVQPRPENANAEVNANANVQARQAGQQEDNEQMRAAGRVFTHMWFLIRVCGLIWFFSNGTTSYRMFLLLLATVVYFAVQMGFLVPQWEQARRHFEGLLGLTNNQQQQGQQATQQGNPQPQTVGTGTGPETRPDANARATVEQRVPPQLTPQDVANRLLREARERREREHEQSRLRQWLMSLERGVALFFASFWPGLGERTIAAREQAQREALQRIREATERAGQTMEQMVNRLAAQQAQTQDNGTTSEGVREDGHSQSRADNNNGPSGESVTSHEAGGTVHATEGSSSAVDAQEATGVRHRDVHENEAIEST
ncbi:MAG: hypothetical protein M1828_001284 [Chrysothrix sp. TS-e1954]|nr:MAG: hypothetical protein M1828_001284 [Chrysothrix sp. TS-e1954]